MKESMTWYTIKMGRYRLIKDSNKLESKHLYKSCNKSKYNKILDKENKLKQWILYIKTESKYQSQGVNWYKVYLR